MDTRHWGPHAWNFIHTVAFNYPIAPTNDDKARFTGFINATADVLPCETCRTHFTELLKTYPYTPSLGSRDALARWSVNAHNIVNRRLGKPEYDFATVAQSYESIRGKTCEAKTCGSLPQTVLECRADQLPVVISVVMVVLLVSIVYIRHICKRNSR